jgi:hypothetical protein
LFIFCPISVLIAGWFIPLDRHFSPIESSRCVNNTKSRSRSLDLAFPAITLCIQKGFKRLFVINESFSLLSHKLGISFHSKAFSPLVMLMLFSFLFVFAIRSSKSSRKMYRSWLFSNDSSKSHLPLIDDSDRSCHEAWTSSPLRLSFGFQPKWPPVKRLNSTSHIFRNPDELDCESVRIRYIESS